MPSLLTKPILKFPQYILDFPPIEEVPIHFYGDKKRIEAFNQGQKRDYTNSLTLAEKSLLETPLISRPSELISLLNTFHGILSQTLYTVNSTTGKPFLEPPGQFRTNTGILSCTKKSRHPEHAYNLSEPADIFGILVTPYLAKLSGVTTLKKANLAAGINFVKWFFKFSGRSESEIKKLKIVEDRIDMQIQNILNTNPHELIPAFVEDAKIWKKLYIEGHKSLTDWLIHFYQKEEGKPFLQHPTDKPLSFDDLMLRATDPRLHSSEELNASQEVVKFFLPSNALEVAAADLTKTFKAKIDSQDHPIDIACYLLQKINSIHFYYNGNGRLARLFMNVVLMNYGLPPVQLEVNSAIKNQYYTLFEKMENDLEAIIEFITGQLHQKEIKSLCIAANKGDTAKILELLSGSFYGKPLSINTPLIEANNSTALHYACKSGDKKSIKLLISLGANINICNAKGKKPISMINEKNIELLYLIQQWNAESTAQDVNERRKTLLEKNTSDNLENSKSATLLLYSAIKLVDQKISSAPNEELSPLANEQPSLQGSQSSLKI